MCMPSTPHCRFSGVSPDGNCTYVHWGSFTSNSKSVRRAIWFAWFSEPHDTTSVHDVAVYTAPGSPSCLTSVIEPTAMRQCRIPHMTFSESITKEVSGKQRRMWHQQSGFIIRRIVSLKTVWKPEVILYIINSFWFVTKQNDIFHVSITGQVKCILYDLKKVHPNIYQYKPYREINMDDLRLRIPNGWHM